MKKNHIVFLLDETGSMESCKKDTIGGFNNFLKDQKKSGNNILFSLTLFNSFRIEKRYTDEAIKNVKPLSSNNYKPSNLTPLWDAVGSTINSLPNQKKVLFVILTDGYENHSKEFSPSAVKKLIQEKEEKGKWKFMFLGADLSNFDDANMVGINFNIGVDKAKTKKMYRNISNTVSNYCATGKVTYNEK